MFFQVTVNGWSGITIKEKEGMSLRDSKWEHGRNWRGKDGVIII